VAIFASNLEFLNYPRSGLESRFSRSDMQPFNSAKIQLLEQLDKTALGVG
jgi:hypothetical protein